MNTLFNVLTGTMIVASLGALGGEAIFLPGSSVKMPAFQAKATDRPQTLAQVKPVLGVPTLVLDGKPYGPMCYTRCAGSMEQIGQIADRDFTVYFEMVGSVGWPGKQDETFQRLDLHLKRFLAKVPNARIILRLYLCNPRYFARDYPEETLTFNDGRRDHFSKWYAMTDRPVEERGYPSFASEVWRKNTAEALYHYVSHVRQSAYSKNIIGYFICGGGTEEWYYWGDYDHNKLSLDFSKPMVKALRDYLRVRYGGDVGKLREAWQDSAVDFDTALPPDPAGRRAPAGTQGAFWNAKQAQRNRDYYYVHSKVMEDSLLIFSRAVKQACNREQLVGMFHGYLQNHWPMEGGQATLLALLNSPDVDFWSAPPQYNRRGQGEHASCRFLMASLKKHGKLWISESDIRTTFSDIKANNPSLYGRPPSVDESLGCLKREFAYQLCEGANGWWFQMGKEWYHHEPILSLFQQQQHIGEAAMDFDRSSDTDIAAVIDMAGILTGPPWPITTSLMDAFRVQELCRIGAPVDYYELNDILAGDTKPYKMYVMINCFSLNGAQRALIEKRLRKNRATLVWMYAPGVFNPDAGQGKNGANTKDLLGSTLASEEAERKLSMKLTTDGAKAFPGFKSDRVFGNFERPEWSFDKVSGTVKKTFPAPRTYPERFYAQENVETLARFEDGGKPAITRRTTNRSVDIWIGSVMAPADLLRCIARNAGCHLFCDGDEIIYADKSFLAIHTGTAGERTFRLRRKADVVEVFTGDVLGTGVTCFKDKIDAFRTRLYFIGDCAKWDSSKQRAKTFFEKFQKELRALRKEDKK